MKTSRFLPVVMFCSGLCTALALPTATTISPTPSTGVNTLTSISVTFSEVVNGVDATDLVVNGTATASMTGTAGTVGPYVFSFAQPAAGTVDVAWTGAHGITGTSGAFGGGAWKYGLGAPIISSIVPTPGITLSSLTTINVTFNQPITNLSVNDLQISGQASASVTGSGAGPYVFTFSQPPAGTVSAAWDADHGISGIGTGTFGGGGWAYTLIDTLAPTIGKIITSVPGQEMDNVFPVAGATVSTLTQARVTFSDAVTGVDAADLLVNGTPATGVTGDTEGPYIFTFPAPADGAVSFSWAGAHGIADGAGNAFIPSGWSITKVASIGTVVISEFLAANAGGATVETALQIPVNSVAAPPAGGSNVITVSAQGAWTAGTAAAWITLSPASGNGSTPFTITSVVNPSTTVARAGTVTISNGTITRTLNVAQAGTAAAAVAGTGLTMNPTTATIASVGSTIGLNVILAPITATAQTVTWSAPLSGTAVVAVNAQGVVTALTTGTATVTATYGTFTATCSVTVASGGKRDENFDGSSWIELLNTGSTTVDLLGWSLTNNYSSSLATWTEPTQWVFPSRTLAAGARLVLWASGKDRKPAGAGHLHTNFSLNVNGGSLALFNPNTPAATPVPASSFLNYPAQRYDVSYGRQSTDNAVRFFSPPTITQTNYTLPSSATPSPTAPAVPLGADNGTSLLTGVTPNPSASVGRGFFNEPFSLLLTCAEPSAIIRYTLNGSAPTASSTVYTTPLNVTNTTVLRFFAAGSNLVPSEVITHSYLFLDNVANQPNPPYDNPAVTTDNTNYQPPSVGGQALPVAWGFNSTFTAAQTLNAASNLTAGQIPADYGMDPKISADAQKYNDAGSVDAAGKTNLERIRQGLRELPMLSLVMKIEDMFGEGPQGLNTTGGIYPTSSSGDKTDRTKSASLEFLNTDGTTEFAIDCGIDNHGNASRDPFKNPKHGFTLRFKGKYGAGKLNDPNLFPDSPVSSWNKMVLRADFNSSWRHQNGTPGNAANSDNYQRARDIRCRDAYTKDAFRDMGHLAGHHRYTNLFINGIYWGTYDLAEDQADDFGSSYLGGDANDFDAIDQGTLKSGTWNAYSSMKTLLGWTGGSPTTQPTTAPTAAVFGTAFTNPQYESLKDMLDMPWFIDYMILHWFTGHRDWATTTDYNKNWYIIRAKNGKFKFLPWDQENLLWHESEDRVTGMTTFASGASPTLYPPAAVHPRIRANAEYKLDCADRIHKACVAPDGVLTPAANIARLDKWTAIVNANAMCLESARWGDYRWKVHAYTLGTLNETYSWNGTWQDGSLVGGAFTPASRLYNTGYTALNLGTYPAGNTMTNCWIAEVNRLKTIYFPARTTNLMAQLRTNGLYPLQNAPQFQHNITFAVLGSQTVVSGFPVKMAFPSSPVTGTVNTGAIWFTTDGNDPRIAYDTTGSHTSTAQLYSTPVIITSTTTVKARALTGTTWSALMESTFSVGSSLPKVVISEINYNPKRSQGSDTAAFVEIMNAGSTPVDMSSWSFSGIDYVFPFGYILGAGDRAVIASNDNPTSFASHHPGVAVAGYYSNNLSHTGERLSLYDKAGRLVFSVEYGVSAPWPVAPNNNGYSLELKDPNADSQNPASWQSSTVLGGTPGQANAVAPAATVIINEFLANGGTASFADGNYDYVELANPGLTSVTISNWTLSVDSAGTSNDGSVIFGSPTTIPAGGRVLIYGTPNFHTGYRIPNFFAKSHGRITLQNAAGTLIDSVRYGPQAFSISFGRNGSAWQLNSPTPGIANSLITTAPLTVVRLNEFLANSTAGEDDWLELANTSSTDPVDLTGLIVERNGEAFRILSPSAVAAAAEARFFCNSGSARGDAILLNLPATGATLSLRAADNTLLDTITYGPQTSDVSQGRLPNGTGPITTLVYPSPNADNHAALTNTPVLNEVLVINRAGDIAPWAHRPSWVEIKNPTGSTLTLDAWQLRNTAGQTWSFPTGTSILTGSSLRVWADPYFTAPTTQFNCGLTLSQPDSLSLLNPLSQTADRVRWGSQVADQSIGRLPDNSWALLTTPTPAGSNSAAAPLAANNGLRINEWLPNSTGDDTDFVEIYNPAATAANLSGLWLGDEPSEQGRRKWQMPELSFIAPTSFGLYQPQSSPAASDLAYAAAPVQGSAQHVTFGLNSDGEYLRLSQNDATTTAIDALNYGFIPTGSSGRYPDGSATVAALSPTPGSSNVSGVTGPFIYEHPISIVRTLGEAARFHIRSTTSTLPTYQWQRNGADIPTATTDVLSLPAITLADDANYTCIVTDGSGSTTSLAAHLTVLYNLSHWAETLSITTAPDDDADQDGLSNRLEFLMGTDPLSALSPAVRDDFLKYSGRETGVTTDLLDLDVNLSSHTVYTNLQGDLTTDLTTWTTTAPSSKQVLSTATNGDQRVRLKFAVPSSAPREFLKLKLVP